MLTTSVQQKIIDALLKRPSNSHCSDCNGKSPCWASLDFGVFICMNCSGAHRALGPSITRVKSTKLDTWHKDWVQNMKIGNSILNQFWESNLSSMPMSTKPNVNSSLNEIKKYVYDKYVKRKYANSGLQDPLTRLKKGTWEIKSQQQQVATKPKTKEIPKQQIPTSDQQPVKKTILKQEIKNSTINKSINTQIIPKKNQQVDLIDFMGHHQPHKVNNNNNAFNFNFNQPHSSEQKNEKSNLHANQKHDNHINFDTFLDNISNKSVSSHGKALNHQQPVHGNYFMSQHGFVNSPSYHHDPHHGFSQPSHNHPHQPTQPTQVTMNINMNMYPNVMNINMGNCPTSTPAQLYPQNQLNHAATSKQFGYDQFLKGNFNTSPQYPSNLNSNNSNQITLEVTIKQKQKQSKKQQSWVDDWM